MSPFNLLASLMIALPCLAAPVQKIKVGVSPALSSAGIYLAKENGYFKDAGLDVELVVMNASTSDMVGLLTSNELQVGAGNLTAGLFNAFNSGKKFKIVADKGHLSEQSPYIWLLVRHDLATSGKVKSTKDLKGLKIGLPSIDGSPQQIVLERILKSAGLTLKDVSLVKIGYPEMNLALKSGAIDSCVQLEPFIYRAIDSGAAIKLVSAQAHHPNQQSAALFFSEGFASASNRSLGEKFIKAYLQGVNEYNSSLKDQSKWVNTAKSIDPYSKIDGPGSWGKMESVGLSADGALDLNSMKADLEWYHQNGFLKQKTPLEAIVDLSYLPSLSQKK